jgi:protein-S-isoprenylcysteine O-methyltransferase Ste14
MKEKNGEHPFGDAGQLIFLAFFLLVWVGDSFFLRKLSGHVVVSHEHRPSDVVSTGAFRYVRHPLYLGCILFYLGLAVSTASLLSLSLLVIIFIFYNYIADYEEKLLVQRFGERYRIYKKSTGKWVPRIGPGS